MAFSSFILVALGASICIVTNTYNVSCEDDCTEESSFSSVKSSSCRSSSKSYSYSESETCTTEETGPMCPYPNEEYSNSSLIPNCPLLDQCISLVSRIICEEPKSHGCVCKSGYKRPSEKEHCIPKCDCPQNLNVEDCE